MKKFNLLIILLVITGLNVAAWVGFTSIYQHKFNQDINQLKNELVQLQQKVAGYDLEQQKLVQATQEAANREAVKQRSQDELLQAAVAKVTPAVVSIVISKDVPKLEIVYENPFGNDPFFKDFNFQVPVYRQKGTLHEKVGAGTGFLVTKDGYIITNKHVVADTAADYTVLLSDGSQKPAQVIYKDSVHDLAVVKIEGSGFTTVELGNSDSLNLGQTVFAVGNALGEYSNSVSVGIISGLDRTIQASGSAGVDQLKGVIQTDAAINPGNSGGPLLNLDGKAVGVNVATVVGSNNISFSIPIKLVKEIINSVINK
ncbi:MAG: trypsin-like peptidase domain-containing protein [Patescibacteria group bacterium]